MHLDQILDLDKTSQEQWFFDNAGYMDDVPKYRYVIRVGSKLFMSDDTMDLRKQVDKYIAIQRRSRTIRSQSFKKVKARRPPLK